MLLNGKINRNSFCAAMALLILCSISFTASAQSLLLDDFETVKWSGGKQDTQHVKQGKYSYCWDAAGPTGLINTRLPEDWSAYAGLAFWCYSENATGQKIHIILRSPGPNGKGDYYHGAFVVNWKGWKQVAIPFQKFRASRKPSGYNKITACSIMSRWGFDHPTPGTILYFDDMRLVSGEYLQEFAEKFPRLLPPLPAVQKVNIPETIVIPTPKSMKLTKETVNLAVNGKPEFAVLMAKEPSRVEMTAANELIAGISALAGISAKAEIIKEGGKLPAVPVIIPLGVNLKMFRKFSVSPPDKAEAYCVKTLKDQDKTYLFLAGKEKIGVYWAVQSVLQLLKKHNGSVHIPGVEISDWPSYVCRNVSASFKNAGNRMAVKYKINVLTNPYWTLAKWYVPDEKYKAMLFKQIKFAVIHGINVLQQVCPYEDNKKHRFIRCSNEKDINMLYDAYKLSLDKGSRIIQISFDDPAGIISSFPPEDKAFFKNNRFKARAYLVKQIAERVKKDYPGTLIIVTPAEPAYYGKTSPVIPYYDTAGVDKDVAVVWTGPKGDISFSLPDEVVKEFVASLNGRRFLLHDNTPGQVYGKLGTGLHGLIIFDLYADKYGKKLYKDAYGILAMIRFNSWRLPELTNIRAINIAEYMWNAENYNAETALGAAMARVAGKKAVPYLLDFKRKYIRIVKVFPELYLDMRKIPEAQRKNYHITEKEYAQLKPALTGLKAAFEKVKSTCRSKALTQELGVLCKRAADNASLFSNNDFCNTLP